MEENTNRVRNSLGLMISQVVKQSSLYKFHKSSQINSKVLKCLYDIMKSYNRRCMRTYLKLVKRPAQKYFQVFYFPPTCVHRRLWLKNCKSFEKQKTC